MATIFAWSERSERGEMDQNDALVKFADALDKASIRYD